MYGPQSRGSENGSTVRELSFVRGRTAGARVAVLGLLLVGCTQGAVPEGWATLDANGLRIAHPEDWQPRAEAERVFPDAQIELVGPAEGFALAPLLVAYAEEGALTDVDTRQTLINQRLQAELDADLVDARELDVPGTTAGRALEFTFDAETPEGGESLPSRQFEVILTADDGRTWDLVLGGPAAVLRQSVADGLLDSLAVDG